MFLSLNDVKLLRRATRPNGRSNTQYVLDDQFGYLFGFLTEGMLP